jgi:Sortase domain
VIDSPPRVPPNPSWTHPVPPGTDARSGWRRRARPLAAGALAVLTVLHLLAALAFLLWLTTVPPKIDMKTGPRPPSVGPQLGPPPAPPGPPEQPSPPGPAVPNPVAPGLIGPALRATVLDIPRLGLRGDLLELGVDAAGVLQPPTSPDVAGWFTGAAAPGEQGPTVIAGHVDSTSGPGVFFALQDLARGDRIDVGRSDGRTASYRVTDVLAVEKDRFPTQLVYGPTAGAELRLITCGGVFDRASGHYLRNIVVSAVLVDPT